jgi:hypothetical protein
MNESEIVRELSRRTRLPEATAAAVLHAMRELISEGAIDGSGLLTPAGPAAAHPEDPGLVDRLIAKAKAHPLGTEFLVSGLLASVAITLGAHAFTVEAARRRLKKEQEAQKKELESKENKNA